VFVCEEEEEEDDDDDEGAHFVKSRETNKKRERAGRGGRE
jgi:hypothetical protein